jgi:hypothetical protein
VYTLAAIKATYRKIVLQSYNAQAPGELLANKLNLNQNSKSPLSEKHISRKAHIKSKAENQKQIKPVIYTIPDKALLR